MRRESRARSGGCKLAPCNVWQNVIGHAVMGKILMMAGRIMGLVRGRYYVRNSAKARGMRMVRRGRAFAYILVIVVLCVSASAASCAQTMELRLAGVWLGRSALTIVQKYGNPSEIRVGPSRQSAATDQFSGMSSAEAPPPGFPSTGPSGFAGFEQPPSFGPPTSGPGSQGGTQALSKPSAPEVTWIYRFPKNRTLEFVINPDGVVIQIAAYGVEWPGLATSKGIKLGSTYRDVILKYGYPESHQRTGLQMVTKYVERNRVAFTFIGRTVVGITIALMD